MDADPNLGGKQIALASGVKSRRIITHRVDEVNGRIILEIDNLSNFSNASQLSLEQLPLRQKILLQIYRAQFGRLGAMIVGQNPCKSEICPARMETNLDYSFILNITGTNQGEITVFTLTDKNGNPVSGRGSI